MSNRNLPVPNIYFDKIFSKRAAKIMPGEYFVTKKDMLVVSVVGSSVVVCIWDNQSGIGGMIHVVAPSQHHELNGVLKMQALNYATDAVASLVQKVLHSGAVLTRLEAKVFSGPCAYDKTRIADVRFIEDRLKLANVQPAMHDLQITPTNKIYFFPKTGKVLVKKLPSLQNNTVFDRQQHYIQSVIANKYQKPPI